MYSGEYDACDVTLSVTLHSEYSNITSIIIIHLSTLQQHRKKNYNDAWCYRHVSLDGNRCMECCRTYYYYYSIFIFIQDTHITEVFFSGVLAATLNYIKPIFSHALFTATHIYNENYIIIIINNKNKNKTMKITLYYNYYLLIIIIINYIILFILLL
jgi:hypothetical protein